MSGTFDTSDQSNKFEGPVYSVSRGLLSMLQIACHLGDLRSFIRGMASKQEEIAGLDLPSKSHK